MQMIVCYRYNHNLIGYSATVVGTICILKGTLYFVIKYMLQGFNTLKHSFEVWQFYRLIFREFFKPVGYNISYIKMKLESDINHLDDTIL